MELKPNDKIANILLIEETYKMDSKRKRKYWKCKCLRCGKEFVAREDLIKDGQQKSCGCLGRSYRSRWLYYKEKLNNGLVQR